MSSKKPSATISGFLDYLANNPDEDARFETNAIGVMRDYGLTERQMTRIMDSNLRQLRRAIKKEIGTKADVYLVKMRP